MYYCPYCMSKNKKNSGSCTVCGESLSSRNDENTLPIGTVLSGKYYIGSKIGQGGFGITYIGINTKTQKRIAVKEFYLSGIVNRNHKNSSLRITAGENSFLYEKERARFVDEARILQSFSGEKYVVDIMDIVSENNTVYIVMEYIDGKDLDNYIQDRGSMSFTEAFLLLEPIIQTLGRIHEAGLIHRDVSPSNIRLNGRREPILLDFGAARDYEIDDTKTYTVILKPGYAPPEQYQNKIKAGPWLDVYGICATIYKMITGCTPIAGLQRLYKDELIPPSQNGAIISKEEEAVLLKGMAVRYEDRYATIDEFLGAISHAMKKDQNYKAIKDIQTEILEPEKETGSDMPKAVSEKITTESFFSKIRRKLVSLPKSYRYISLFICIALVAGTILVIAFKGHNKVSADMNSDVTDDLEDAYDEVVSPENENLSEDEDSGSSAEKRIEEENSKVEYVSEEEDSTSDNNLEDKNNDSEEIISNTDDVDTVNKPVSKTDTSPENNTVISNSENNSYEQEQNYDWNEEQDQAGDSTEENISENTDSSETDSDADLGENVDTEKGKEFEQDENTEEKSSEETDEKSKKDEPGEDQNKDIEKDNEGSKSGDGDDLGSDTGEKDNVTESKSETGEDKSLSNEEIGNNQDSESGTNEGGEADSQTDTDMPEDSDPSGGDGEVAVEEDENNN